MSPTSKLLKQAHYTIWNNLQDNYILEIKDKVEKDSPLRLLILAAVICIDMVVKE